VAGPLADFEGSVRIHAHVLDAVRRNAPEARVITLSSAAVYGNPQSLPIAEDSILAPISPYGYHKVLCETLLKEYYTVYGVQSAALRIFSAYGAGLRRQLLWDVCEKATAGEVRLFGTGEETRDFIHADDVARACLAIAEGAPMHGEPYNVASGDETTVREVAERLVGEIAQGLPIHFTGEVRLGDPLRWQADISSVRALGFQPRVSLAEGVADYATWYESLRG
jgi:UDP-glucose 4-epimerase